MTTNGIASTALDFLATIDPDDSVWDDDGIEGFVQEFQSLATKKRHEREQSRINRAIETLRAEIESLPDGEFEIDLGAFVSADVPAIDAEAVLSRIEAMTEAVTTYRQEAARTTDGTSLTIAERTATYQAMASSLTLITDFHNEIIKLVPKVKRVTSSTTKNVAPISRRRHNSIPVTREMWTAAYFLARYGKRVGGGPASAPSELGDITWKAAFHLFYIRFNDGRNAHRFRKRLENCRDSYDRYVDSGRRGWDAKLTAAATEVLNEWQYRPREELWEYVKQFVKR